MGRSQNTTLVPGLNMSCMPEMDGLLESSSGKGRMVCSRECMSKEISSLQRNLCSPAASKYEMHSYTSRCISSSSSSSSSSK
eukprot:6487173-Amphidinium_carterae.1